MSLLSRLKIDKNNPLFNLNIELETNKTSFESEENILDKIEEHGKAIYNAKKLFSKELYVTQKGYIVEGNVRGVPYGGVTSYCVEKHNGKIDIQKNELSLLMITEVLDKKAEPDSIAPIIIDYPDGKQHIEVDKEFNLYIPEVRMSYDRFKDKKYPPCMGEQIELLRSINILDRK